MTDNIEKLSPANELDRNCELANTGLNQLKHWKNNLGHTPFYCASIDDGSDPLIHAQGMVGILARLFSEGHYGPEGNEIANISDSTVAAALEGVSTLLNLAQLEAQSFEHIKAKRQKGGA